MVGRDIQLYAGCCMQDTTSRWSSHRDTMDANSQSKPELLLQLTTKRKVSYGKGDVWVISSDLLFSPGKTCVAISTFFGPNSELQLSLQAVSGYHPALLRAGATASGTRQYYFVDGHVSQLTSSALLLFEDTLFAIHAFNAGGELNCLDNVRDHIRSDAFPLLPHLLSPAPRVSHLFYLLLPNRLVALPQCFPARSHTM